MTIRLPCAKGTALVLTALAAASLVACVAPDAIPGNQGGSGASGGAGGGAAAGGDSPGYDLVWAKTYGLDEDFDKRALSVAATPDGGALLAGEFEGSLAISPLPELPNTEERDGFAALFGADGTPERSLAFSGPGDQRVWRALPAPGGGVLLAGGYTLSLYFDGSDQGDTPENADGFVAHVDQAGNLDWLVRVPGPGDQVVHSIALTTAGEVVLAGTFQSTLQVGDLTTTEEAEGRDFFVAKLDPAGNPLWATSLGAEPGNVGWLEPPCFVATGQDGGIHVAGTFTGTVRLGDNLGAVGDRDVFIGKLSPDGQPLWGHAAGVPSTDQQVFGLAVNGAGLAALSGHVRGDVQLDASTTLRSEGAEPDAFLAIYDAPGNLVWARRYGSKAQDHGGPVAFDPAGNILYTGRFRGSIGFGAEGVLDNSGAVSGHDDIFVATLTPSGEPLTTAAFGEDDNQVATSVAATSTGDVLLGGWFRGTVDFGGGALTALNGDDLFVAKLARPAP